MDGLVAVRKRDYRLRLAFIGHREVGLVEILDQLVAIGDLNVHPHIGNAGFERRSSLDCRLCVRCRARGVELRCINLSRRDLPGRDLGQLLRP